ncbi:MAG: pyridoxal-dependent decarboxylase [Candidatus Pacebacteria bacterium]|nr:pyridoxal-dependent decarboxylase [Candidatus Paceibacterota bacterium]
MKENFLNILDAFTSRPQTARVHVTPKDIETELEKIQELEGNEMISALAELYFKNNPNVYAPGNNARLYTRPESEALLGAFIALLANNSGGTFKSNPVGSVITKKVFDYMINDLIGYEKAEAIDTSGGMAANAMAIQIARYYFYPDARDKGNGNSRFVLMCSDQSHYSQDGAMNRAGLGIDNICYISTDFDGTIDLLELERSLKEYKEAGYNIIVSSTYGTTVLGAFDDVEVISNLCFQYGAWHHVDASWGGPAAISNDRKLFGDLSRADSVTLDAHKAFKSTLTCGIFVTQHVGLLKQANLSPRSTKYLYHEDPLGLDNGVRGLECGKSDRLLPFGTLLLSRGNSGLTEMIDRDLQRAKYFTECVSNSPYLKLMHAPQYLNVCVQIKSPFQDLSDSNFTKFVSDRLLNQKQSNIMVEICKYSELDGYVLRFVISNPEMTTESIHGIISELTELREEMMGIHQKQIQQVS